MMRPCPKCSAGMVPLTNFDAYKCIDCGWLQSGLDIVQGRLTDQDEAKRMIQEWIDAG